MRAGIAVVARLLIVRIEAALHRITAIVRAKIVVVAVQVRGAKANSSGAGVKARTNTPVVTGHHVGDVLAAYQGIAGIVRADIFVVAVQLTLYALPVHASIPRCADAVVVATARDVLVLAALDSIAGVGRARIVVFAFQRQSWHAGSVAALVALGAGVAVVAGRLIVGVLAPGRRNARIIGADIAVVAVQWSPPGT